MLPYIIYTFIALNMHVKHKNHKKIKKYEKSFDKLNIIAHKYYKIAPFYL